MKKRLAIEAGLALLFCALSACHHAQYGVPVDMSGVRFFAYSQLTGVNRDSVTIHVHAVNESKETRQFEFGQCGIGTLVRVYDIKGRGRVWNLDKWANGEGPAVFSPFRPPEACILSLLVTTVPPGGGMEVDRLTLPVRIILGDSLEPGTYHFEARSSMLGRPVDFVGAGNLVLTAPPRLRTRIVETSGPTMTPAMSVALIDSVSGEAVPYTRFVFQPPDTDTSNVANRHASKIGSSGAASLPIPAGARRLVMLTNGYLPNVIAIAPGRDVRIIALLQRDPDYKRPGRTNH